ncbi:MAG: DUF4625 domain-containing protein [Flavobacteriales bacterium]|nr:DUF4625 domain-containing protein [Flavobacteriales bacterium]
MNIKKINIVAIILVTFSIIGCNKDKESPVISVSSPAMHDEYNYGDMIHVEATFTDDVDLASYSVSIGDESGGDIMGFESLDEDDITGVSHDYMGMITVPDTLMMSMFYLHIELTDLSGKTSSEKIMLHTTM